MKFSAYCHRMYRKEQLCDAMDGACKALIMHWTNYFFSALRAGK